jgi:hypothetical protein
MPVPAIFGKRARLDGAAAFYASSNPGIRRPRWGGVAEGVVVSATPSRTKKGVRINPVAELTGIGVTDAHLCGY